MYKSTPITKKAKTAGEYNSALKQVDLVGGSAQTYSGFKSYAVEPGKEGKKGKKGKEKTRVYTYDDMRADGATEAEIEAAKKYNEEKYGTQNPTKEGLADNTTGTGKFEPDEPDVPGTPDEITAFQTKRKNYKDNVGNLENREMNRVIKKAEKDVRRGKIKSARSEAKGYTVNEKGEAVETEGGKLKGKAKRDFMKKARQKAKAEERAAETKAFKDRAANAAEGQASGKGLDTRFRSTDVDETQGDFTRPEQAERLKMKKTYDASTKTDSQRLANEAIKIGTNGFTLAGGDTSAGDAFVNKFGKGTGLFMKKSPMKKSYFKK